MFKKIDTKYDLFYKFEKDSLLAAVSLKSKLIKVRREIFVHILFCLNLVVDAESNSSPKMEVH